jgi:hypothetical protein
MNIDKTVKTLELFNDNHKHTHEALFIHLKEMFDQNLIDAEGFKEIVQKYKEIKNEKGWHEQHELILVHISECSECYRDLHLRSARSDRILENMFIMPTILSTLSVSLFTLVANNYDGVDSGLLATISGGCSLISGTITAMLKQWNLSKSINTHEMVANTFGKISHEIKFELSLPPEERSRMPMFLDNMIQKYQEIVFSAPKIPRKIIKYYKLKFKGDLNDENVHLPVEVMGIKAASVCKNIPIISKQMNDNNSNKSDNKTTNDKSTEIHLEFMDKLIEDIHTENP